MTLLQAFIALLETRHTDRSADIVATCLAVATTEAGVATEMTEQSFAVLAAKAYRRVWGEKKQ